MSKNKKIKVHEVKDDKCFLIAQDFMFFLIDEGLTVQEVITVGLELKSAFETFQKLHNILVVDVERS